MKFYKPNYGTLFLLAGFVILVSAISILKAGSLDIVLLISMIVFVIIFAFIELALFTSAVEFYEDEMRIYSGLKYLLKLSPHRIKYDQITAITENLTPRAKFSNMKINTKDKQYMIFIHGMQNYKDMKADLMEHKPTDVEIVRGKLLP